MIPHHMCRIALFMGLGALASVRAQIITTSGDGVLNAPYRGTIDSLRECSADLAYGEVQPWVEPTGNDGISSPTMMIWHDPAHPWDRSVLRMYYGLDASGASIGTEVDLTMATSQATAIMVAPESGGFRRFSFKAIGTKTLATQTFTVVFRYTLLGNTINHNRTFYVAPIT
ncbi:MAG TPA: hypothetical protein VGM03_00030, partial [Phycisphaerae bacterium]